MCGNCIELDDQIPSLSLAELRWAYDMQRNSILLLYLAEIPSVASIANAI
jgi:hypothetical protein